MSVHICTDAQCEKFIKAFCKLPKSCEQKEGVDIVDMAQMGCTCRVCFWDFGAIAKGELEACACVGDEYNTDFDCIALK